MEHPTGLTIDLAMDHMVYWVDTKLNLVEAMREDGSRRRTIISGDRLQHPFALDVFESSVSALLDSAVLGSVVQGSVVLDLAVLGCFTLRSVVPNWDTLCFYHIYLLNCYKFGEWRTVGVTPLCVGDL